MKRTHRRAVPASAGGRDTRLLLSKNLVADMRPERSDDIRSEPEAGVIVEPDAFARTKRPVLRLTETGLKRSGELTSYPRL